MPGLGAGRAVLEALRTLSEHSLEGRQDLRVVSWLLFPELVAGEAQNDQTKWCKLFL